MHITTIQRMDGSQSKHASPTTLHKKYKRERSDIPDRKMKNHTRTETR